jgi:hypothetical protein
MDLENPQVLNDNEKSQILNFKYQTMTKSEIAMTEYM